MTKRDAEGVEGVYLLSWYSINLYPEGMEG